MDAGGLRHLIGGNDSLGEFQEVGFMAQALGEAAPLLGYGLSRALPGGQAPGPLRGAMAAVMRTSTVFPAVGAPTRPN